METKIMESPADLNQLFGFEVKVNGFQVYWTKDYSKFTFMDGNREVNLLHVKRLKNLILQNGWDKSSILIVNSKMRVGDGQHRIIALREILQETGRSFEVGFIVDNTINLKKIQSKNSNSRAWSVYDYLYSNIKLGKKDYLIIQEINKKFHFPVSAIIRLSGKTNFGTIHKKFQDGELIISDPQELWERACMVDSLKPYIEFYKNTRFIEAMAFYFSHPAFSFAEFLEKVITNRSMLYPCATSGQYKKMIQDVYNYRRREKVTFLMA